ncbi:MAG: DUF4893 domain-containing protein [Mesorhizobium sp.]
MKKRTTSVAFLCLLAVCGSAFATGAILSTITPADQKRLDNYEKTRAAAIAEAKSGGDPVEFTGVEKLLNAKQLEFSGMDLTGNWRCRVVKLGENLPLVVYGWFKCKVTDDGSGWQLEKRTGSQRTKGRFYDDSPTRLTYLGAGYIDGDTPPAYGAGPKSDQVGYAFRTGKDSWRIEFPEPYYESKLDVLELRR